jgi:hypothetical protein
MRESKADRAQDRRGTRRARGFMSTFYNAPNGFTACSTLLNATPRQWKKAETLRPSQMGRVVRACWRALRVEDRGLPS